MGDPFDVSKDMIVHSNIVSDNTNPLDSEIIKYPLPTRPKVTFEDDVNKQFLEDKIPGKEKKPNTIHEEVIMNKMKNKLTRGYQEPLIVPPRSEEILMDRDKESQVVIESLNKNLVKNCRL